MTRTIRRNLKLCYEQATCTDYVTGFHWYAEAHNQCLTLARGYSLTLAQVCGVLAALSPGRTWELNVRDTHQLLKAWYFKIPFPQVGTYGQRNIQKCASILDGSDPLDILGGLKVRAFYQNILDPTNPQPVTIDRHAKCAAHGTRLGDKASIVRPSEYEYLATQYRHMAAKFGLRPAEFQAIIWTVWRRIHFNTRKPHA